MKRLFIILRKKVIVGPAVLALAVAIFALGCVGGGYSVGYASGGYAAGETQSKAEHGPPPWAPAHGRRAKHSYSYYPAQGVYFSAAQGLYFHLGSDGSWRASARLPGSITLSGGGVTLEMDTDRPYNHHNDVIKRYPPGKKKSKQSKNKGQSKGKSKQRGH